MHETYPCYVWKVNVLSGCHSLNGNIMNDVCDGECYSSHPVFNTSDALQIFGCYD